MSGTADRASIIHKCGHKISYPSRRLIKENIQILKNKICCICEEKCYTIKEDSNSTNSEDEDYEDTFS